MRCHGHWDQKVTAAQLIEEMIIAGGSEYGLTISFTAIILHYTLHSSTPTPIPASWMGSGILLGRQSSP